MGSVRVHIKGAFIAVKMDRARAVYFTQDEQVIIMSSYEELKKEITMKGNTVAHDKAREACWQKIPDRVNSQVKIFCILSK